MEKDYYEIGFESKIFKVPKSFLNKYKEEVLLCAKKEVFKDVENLVRTIAGDFGETPIYKDYQELKKRHLSTSQKEKALSKAISDAVGISRGGGAFASFLQRIKTTNDIINVYKSLMCEYDIKGETPELKKQFTDFFNKEWFEKSVFLLCMKELEKKRFKSDVVDSGDYPTINKKDVVLWSDVIKILGGVMMK